MIYLDSTLHATVMIYQDSAVHACVLW